MKIDHNKLEFNEEKHNKEKYENYVNELEINIQNYLNLIFHLMRKTG